METFTTPEAAEQIGLKASSLRVWLTRHEQYKPARKVGYNYLWTQEEIDAVIKQRAEYAEQHPNGG